MGAPISVRLDPEVQKTLAAEAQRRQIGLSELLRKIAADAAREVKRKRIREQTEAVGKYVARSPEAQEFFEYSGTWKMERL